MPALADLPVFLRLLARSATGQPISAYTTLLTGPREGGELHIVLVDNGRSALLANPAHRSALACIRCGACLNTCPVYRRAGGHAYGTVIPGPIGSVLGPALGGEAGARAAARLVAVRELLGGVPGEDRPARPAARVARRAARAGAAPSAPSPRAPALALRWPALRGLRARRAAPALAAARPPRWRRNPAEPWLAARELPPLPRASFRAQWQQRERARRDE